MILIFKSFFSFATFKVIIQGADGILRLATPEEHEAWCPFGIQIEMIRLDTQSRKSSATNLSRKSSCKPDCNLELYTHEFFFVIFGIFILSFGCTKFDLIYYIVVEHTVG